MKNELLRKINQIEYINSSFAKYLLMTAQQENAILLLIK